MKASQALAIAKSAFAQPTELANQLLKRIEAEAQQGKYYLFDYKTVDAHTQAYLQRLGYAVETGDDRGESYTKISWFDNTKEKA